MQRKAALKHAASVGTASSTGQSSARLDAAAAPNTALSTSSSSSSSAAAAAAAAAAKETFAFKSIRETAVKPLAWPENVVNVHMKMQEIWTKPVDVGTVRQFLIEYYVVCACVTLAFFGDDSGWTIDVQGYSASSTTSSLDDRRQRRRAAAIDIASGVDRRADSHARNETR